MCYNNPMNKSEIQVKIDTFKSMLRYAHDDWHIRMINEAIARLEAKLSSMTVE